MIGKQTAQDKRLVVDYLSIDSLPSEPVINSIPFDKVDILVLDLWMPSDQLIERLEPMYAVVKKFQNATLLQKKTTGFLA